MKDLKTAKNTFINDYFLKHNRLPDDEILKDFKKGYRKFYLKEYRKRPGRRKRIQLTLSDEEFKLLESFAKKYKKKKSTLSKEIIIKHIKQEKILTADIENKLQEAIIQLRKIGNNINQLTKLANQNSLNDPIQKKCFNEALIHLSKIEDEIINSIIKK